MTTVIHHKTFEMGQAPYRFVCIWSHPSPALAEQNPRAYNYALEGKPAYCHCTCDHCGMPIVHHHIIRDAAGKLFAVGSSCIGKIDNTELLTASKRAEKLRARALRREKAEQARQAAREAREAALQAERDRNGGLTDWEVEKAAQDAENERLQNQRATIAAEIIAALESAGGNFCADMVRQIKQGRIPAGRAAEIIVEIVAKQAGRKGSKAYDQAAEVAEALFEKITSQLQELK